jgi:hypothetical protein
MFVQELNKSGAVKFTIFDQIGRRASRFLFPLHIIFEVRTDSCRLQFAIAIMGCLSFKFLNPW